MICFVVNLEGGLVKIYKGQKNPSLKKPNLKFHLVTAARGVVFALGVKMDMQENVVTLSLIIYDRDDPGQMVEVEFETAVPSKAIPNEAISIRELLAGDAEVRRKIEHALEYFLAQSAALLIEYEDNEDVAFYLKLHGATLRASTKPAKVLQFMTIAEDIDAEIAEDTQMDRQLVKKRKK